MHPYLERAVRVSHLPNLLCWPLCRPPAPRWAGAWRAELRFALNYVLCPEKCPHTGRASQIRLWDE